MPPPPWSPPATWRTVHVIALAIASWLLMQVAHEAGHVLHASWSGATVERVVLHPLALSRTDLGDNPHPLLVAWGGALWGCLLPLVLLGLSVLVRPRVWDGRHLARFFAGFCLVANGAYLLMGWGTGEGDARDLLAHGSPGWAVVAAGLAMAAGGLACWHGVGRGLGFGEGGRPVRRGEALAVTALATATIAIECLLGTSA